MNNSVLDSQTFSVHFVAAAPSITLMLDKNIVNKKAHDNNEFYMPAHDDEQGINRYAIKGGLVIKKTSMKNRHCRCLSRTATIRSMPCRGIKKR